MPPVVTSAHNDVPTAVALYSGLIYRLIGYPASYEGSPYQSNADTMEAIVAAYTSLPIVIPSPQQVTPTTPGVTFKWTTKYSAAPSAVSISIQGSTNNSSWTTLDTSTNTAGESRTVSTAQNYVYFRAIVNSVTGSVNGEVTFQPTAP